MDNLYAIMENLLALEHKQKSLECVLNTIEAAYRDKKQTAENMLLSNIKWQIEQINNDLRQYIGELDSYIAKHAKTKR